MKLFVSELQYVSELYNRLCAELSLQDGNGVDAAALNAAVLRNRELLSRVEQMNGRLAQLAKDWDAFRGHLDPQSRESIRALASSVGKQGEQLALLIERRTRDLEGGRRNVEKALKEIRQGVRYLASVRPTKTNYPKFIDSLG